VSRSPLGRLHTVGTRQPYKGCFRLSSTFTSSRYRGLNPGSTCNHRVSRSLSGRLRTVGTRQPYKGCFRLSGTFTSSRYRGLHSGSTCNRWVSQSPSGRLCTVGTKKNCASSSNSLSRRITVTLWPII